MVIREKGETCVAGELTFSRLSTPIGQRDARVTSRLSPQSEQAPYSLTCVPACPVFTAARYAVEGSMPSARAKHWSQKLRGSCRTRNAATRSLAIIVTNSRADAPGREDVDPIQVERAMLLSLDPRVIRTDLPECRQLDVSGPW